MNRLPAFSMLWNALSLFIILTLFLVACSSSKGIPSNITQIAVDGSLSDWVGRKTIFEDPPGDGEAGFLDLTKGFAFVNKNALYILIETADPKASFVQFDIIIDAGTKRVLIS